MPKEYEARIRIVGRDDQTWGELVVPPTGPGNPTGVWERNDIFKAQYRVPVEPRRRARARHAWSWSFVERGADRAGRPGRDRQGDGQVAVTARDRPARTARFGSCLSVS